jgi:hypothetical protein
MYGTHQDTIRIHAGYNIHQNTSGFTYPIGNPPQKG